MSSCSCRRLRLHRFERLDGLLHFGEETFGVRHAAKALAERVADLAARAAERVLGKGRDGQVEVNQSLFDGLLPTLDGGWDREQGRGCCHVATFRSETVADHTRMIRQRTGNFQAKSGNRRRIFYTCR